MLGTVVVYVSTGVAKVTLCDPSAVCTNIQMLIKRLISKSAVLEYNYFTVPS